MVIKTKRHVLNLAEVQGYDKLLPFFKTKSKKLYLTSVITKRFKVAHARDLNKKQYQILKSGKLNKV